MLPLKLRNKLIEPIKKQTWDILTYEQKKQFLIEALIKFRKDIIIDFGSMNKYQNWWARNNGYKNMYDYKNHMAKMCGFKSKYDRDLHNLKKRGFKSIYDYQKYLAKRNGFKDTNELKRFKTFKKRFRGIPHNELLNMFRKYESTGKWWNKNDFGVLQSKQKKIIRIRKNIKKREKYYKRKI